MRRKPLIPSFVATLVLLFAVVLLPLLAPKPAHAQWSDIAAFAQRTGKFIWDFTKDATESLSAVGFNQVIGTMVKQYAYDAAVYIATGDRGQDSLVRSENVMSHLRDTADAAYGNYLDSMSKDIWGRSLCDQGPLFKANLSIALKQISRPDIKSTCKLSDVEKNIGKYRRSFEEDGYSSIAEFNATLSPQSSELGIFLTAFSGAKRASVEATESEGIEGTQNFYKPVKTKVTGETKTPAEDVEEVSKSRFKSIIDTASNYTGDLITDTSKIFFTTLLSEWLKKTFNEGLVPVGPGGSGGTSAIARARSYYESVNSVAFGSGQEVKILEELAVEGYIDASFISAANEKLTIREAVDQGRIQGDWVLGYSNPSAGVEPDLEQGWGYSKLKRLRQARLFPIGLELASIKIRSLGQAYSLKHVMDCFEDPLDPENAALPENCQIDGKNPFFHLVDPNWVITGQPTFCAKEGFVNYEPDIINAPSSSGAIRAEACVDLQTCLKKDGNGKCVAYGNCTEDEQRWALSGDACSAEFASCTSYVNSSGETVAYLSNTVNANGCAPGSEGCGWYCSQTDGSQWTCTEEAPYDDRIFFDADVGSCDEQNQSCTGFIRSTGNLAGNGSFELTHDVAGVAMADGWSNGSGGEIEATTDQSSEGTRSLKFSDRAELGILNSTPLRFRQFELSFVARADAACQMTGTFDGSGERAAGSPLNVSATDWETFSVSHLFRTADAKLTLLFDAGNCGTVYLDRVMFQERSSTPALAYIEYGAPASLLHLKEGSLCKGGDRDRFSCRSDAECTGGGECVAEALCSAGDVGCQFYTPEQGGDPVPGQINPSFDPSDPNDSCSAANGDGVNPYTGDQCNVCPDDKVGCQAYFRTGSTLFFPSPAAHESRQEGQVNFIGSTGEACTASAVFCEQYTNLDEVAQGGEGLEYYTFIRACAKPDHPDVRTFYRWVGDDTQGYQLVSEQLLKSNTTGAPCTHASVNANGVVACDDGNYPQAPEPPQDCRAQFGTDPDCVEYFNSLGSAFYRYQSKTASASEDCHPLRNTLDGKIYPVIPEQSRRCDAAYQGCREYKGSAGYNVKTLLEENYDNGVVWDAVPGAGAVLSSINTPLRTGRSMVMQGAVSRSYGAQKDITELLPADAQGKVRQSYVLNFWAYSDSSGSPLRAFLEDETGGQTLFEQQSVTLVAEWREYTLGPLFLDRAKTLREELHFDGQTAPGKGVYIDELTLVENHNLYLLHDSYTPCEDWFVGCQAYQNAAGEVQGIKSFRKICNENAVGCEQLYDTQNSSSPFERRYAQGNYNGASVADVVVPADEPAFRINASKYYCDADFEGCEAFGKPTFNQEGGIDAFKTVSLINDPDQYDLVQGGTLCRGEAFQCQSYETEDGTALFKDPGESVCEFRSGKTTESTGWFKKASTSSVPDCPVTHPGLYGNPTGAACAEVCVSGANVGKACATNASCGAGGQCGSGSSKKDVGKACASSADCNGGAGMDCQYWVGLCPATQNQCTQFIEPEGLNQDNGLNNADFSTVNENGDVPEFWEENGNAIQVYQPNQTDRLRVAFAAPSTLLSQPVELDPHTYYKVSAEIKHQSSPANFHVSIFDCKDEFGREFGDPGTEEKVGVEAIDGTMAGANDEFQNNRPFDEIELDIGFPQLVTSPQWVEGRFYSGDARDCLLAFGFTGAPADAGWVNQLQLKEIETSTMLKNEKIDAGSCNQNVDTDQGCILFNDTSETLLSSFTSESYKNEGSPVKGPQSGVACDATNPNFCNANTVLRADRDRDCSAWLSCATSQRIFNPTTGDFDEICYEVGNCKRLAPDNTSCAEWSEPKSTVIATQDFEDFQTRNGYSGNETGTTIPDLVNAELLSQQEYPVWDASRSCASDEECGPLERCDPVNVLLPPDDATNPQHCVQYEVNLTHLRNVCAGDTAAPFENGQACDFNSECDPNNGGRCSGLVCGGGGNDGIACATNAQCPGGTCSGLIDAGAANQSCSADSECPTGQICRTKCDPNNLDCGYNGSNGDGVCVIPSYCRAYPAQDAPWPATVDALNNCIEGYNCECNYQKLTYENGTIRYADFNAVPASLGGSCEYIGGDQAGEAVRVQGCTPRSFPSQVPGVTEQPSLLTKREASIGFKGFCLDQNLSKVVNDDIEQRACFAPLPVDNVLGQTNFLANDPGATVVIPEVAKWQCVGMNQEYTVEFENPSKRSSTYHPAYQGVKMPRTEPAGGRCFGSKDNCQDEAAGFVCEVSKNLFGNYNGRGDDRRPGYFEIADEGESQWMEWEWEGPSYYKFQIKEIQVTFTHDEKEVDNDYSECSCQGDCDDEMDGINGKTSKVPYFDNNEWTGTTVSGSDQSATAGAKFDPTTGLLTHIRVKAADDGGSGSARVGKVGVVLQEGCDQIANVKDLGGDGPYPKTDVLDDGKQGDGQTPFEFANDAPDRIAETVFADECAPFGGFQMTNAEGLTIVPNGSSAGDWEADFPRTPGDPTTCYAHIAYQRSATAQQLDELFGRFILKQFDEGTTLQYSVSKGYYDGLTNSNSSECPVIASTKDSGAGLVEDQANPARDGEDCTDGWISVNGADDSGTKILGSGSVRVNLSFFAYNEDGNQLPLKTVEIDWDDGTAPNVFNGSFANRRSRCDGVKFGDRTGSCREEPFSFTHDYRSAGTFQPKVQVIDNWGLTNGGGTVVRKTEATFRGSIVVQ